MTPFEILRAIEMELGIPFTARPSAARVETIRQHIRELKKGSARSLGAMSTDKKAAAARANGSKGGRPQKISQPGLLPDQDKDR